MSLKERIRLEALGRVKRKEITIVRAAELAGVSIRQMRRLWKRYTRDYATRKVGYNPRALSSGKKGGDASKERNEFRLGSRARIRVQEVIPVAKSKPYSSVSVKSVDFAALAAEHPGQACVLGIDVAKFELMCVLRWPDGSFHRPWRVVNPDEAGVLIEKLKGLRAALGSNGLVTVAMESSGTYGDAVRQALSDADIPVHRVSAKAVKDQAETFDGVPSQHDGKDAAIIADLCGRGKGKPWAMTAGDASDQEIRYWVRRVDAAQRVKQMWGGKLEALLARHWPEATRLMPGSSATLSKALSHWGDPAALAADPKAAQMLRSFGGHYLTDAKIAALIAAAKQSGGGRANAWESREMRELAGQVVARRKEISEAKGQLRISKRGQRLTRKWMYFGALRWMRDPAVKRWTGPKKARDGGKGSRAMVGVMRRLALAAWHLAVNGVEFDAARLFPGAAKGSATAVKTKAMTMQTI
jgi:transposase